MHVANPYIGSHTCNLPSCSCLHIKANSLKALGTQAVLPLHECVVVNVWAVDKLVTPSLLACLPLSETTAMPLQHFCNLHFLAVEHASGSTCD